MRNYLKTANPFGLADPPKWFLRQLHAQDEWLVIFPSVLEPCYRICRRAQRGAGEIVARLSADHAIAVQHKMYAITSVPGSFTC